MQKFDSRAGIDQKISMVTLLSVLFFLEKLLYSKCYSLNTWEYLYTFPVYQIFF